MQPFSVKGNKDVLVSLKTHGRVYYPYCRHEGISVIFNFINEPTVTNNIEKKDWELIIKPNNPLDTDLVESWKVIFNIQQRYEEIIEDYVFKTWETNMLSVSRILLVILLPLKKIFFPGKKHLI